MIPRDPGLTILAAMDAATALRTPWRPAGTIDIALVEALQPGIEAGQIVQVTSRHGQVGLPAHIDERIGLQGNSSMAVFMFTPQVGVTTTFPLHSVCTRCRIPGGLVAKWRHV